MTSETAETFAEPAAFDCPAAFVVAGALLAVALPALLTYNVAPSATFFNQAASVIGWGVFLLLLVPLGAGDRFVRWRGGSSRLSPESGCTALAAGLAVLLAASFASSLYAGLPAALVLSAVGSLLAAALVFEFGAESIRLGTARRAFDAVCVALVACGLVSTVLGLLQVYLPEWTGNDWIAAVGDGRAAGNLRQANHLGTLLLWSCVALVWLGESARLDRRLPPIIAAACVYGLVLTASRTATLGVIALGVWGLLDRRLSPASRWLLRGLPLLYALIWWALSAWAERGDQPFAGAGRFSAQGDVSSSRLAIWGNALALIASRPWLGVGWGEFNLAWTMTPFPGRPVLFFDNAHNLPLQLAVEIGVPLALVVFGLLAFALWRAFAASRWASGERGTLRRCAFMMVLLVGIHSLLEYPLWYSYFLLPTMFVWGLSLGALPAGDARGGSGRTAAAASELRSLRRQPIVFAAGALLMIAGGVFAVVDYQRVARIFSSDAGATPLAERIADGEKSWLFAHHAHYAAATTAEPPSAALASFDVAKHYLLDTRLMMAWAQALHERGDIERARHVAARLREFRNEDSREFFDGCEEAPPPAGGDAAPILPFQCTPPSRTMDYRDFR